MLQLDLKTFLKPFPGWPFLSADFFLSFHAPSEFMSLFTAHNNKEGGLRKVLDDKNVGDSEAVRRYFSGQRAKTGTLSYPSTEINLPFKTKGLRWGYEKRTLREAEN